MVRCNKKIIIDIQTNWEKALASCIRVGVAITANAA